MSPTDAEQPSASAGEQPKQTEPGWPTWSRLVIVGAATLAVLLVGATLGMLLTRTTLEDDEASAQPGADSIEVGFAQDMSVHHVQAVTLANWARDHSSDPAIKQLAFDIGSTQNEQVGRMKGWLMLWDQPEQSPGPPMAWMAGHGPRQHGHDMSSAGAHSDGATGTDGPAAGALMPGMATNAELSRLRSLSGDELDVFFLQLMLRHHQGGTDMAQYAKQHSTVGAVRELARSMLESQGAEVELMTDMLAARSVAPLPFR